MLPWISSLSPRSVLLIGALALCSLPVVPATRAFAAPLPAGMEINPVSGSRSLYAFGASYCPGCGINGEDEYYSNSDSDGTPALGLWDESVSSLGSGASQSTIISSGELAGQISVSTGGSGDNSATASFTATFTVNQPGTYALIAEVGGSAWEEILTLESDLGTILDLSYRSGTFHESFELVPGRTYTLTAFLHDQDYSGRGGGAITTFALVPEPSTALLVGIGITVLGSRRRVA